MSQSTLDRLILPTILLVCVKWCSPYIQMYVASNMKVWQMLTSFWAIATFEQLRLLWLLKIFGMEGQGHGMESLPFSFVCHKMRQTPLSCFPSLYSQSQTLKAVYTCSNVVICVYNVTSTLVPTWICSQNLRLSCKMLRLQALKPDPFSFIAPNASSMVCQILEVIAALYLTCQIQVTCTRVYLWDQVVNERPPKI